MLKELNEGVEEVKKMGEQNENIVKEIALKILELKSTIIEMKISLEVFRGTFEQVEESAIFLIGQ